MEPIKVLFVCTGNSCRSPMAEGILKQLLKASEVEGVEVRSAGTIGAGGYPASEGSIWACEEIGVDLSEHTSTPLTTALIAKSDLIFCMEHHHANQVKSLMPTASVKIHLLGEFGPPDKPLEISDPVGLPLKYYRECRDHIIQCLEGLMERLPDYMQQRSGIVIAASESGAELKKTLLEHLLRRGCEVRDFRAYGSETNDDLDAAIEVARLVSAHLAAHAIVVGTSGIGMTIAANKFPGVRAALCSSPEYAAYARSHHDANVLCIGSSFIPTEEAIQILDAWIATNYAGPEESYGQSVFDRLEYEFQRG